MTYVVKATLGVNRRRVTSRKFKTRRAAQRFADATNRDRPGSNARVTDI
jgi:hypothetical protein|tara:strand:- start:509 stop:655 length:147 start_codon:yes stop_codon:yes gene_type:complete